MDIIEALREEQCTIIARGMDKNYPVDKHLEDLDLIADLAELKLEIRKRRNGRYKVKN